METKSYSRIAKKYGVSRKTIADLLRTYGIEPLPCEAHSGAKGVGPEGEALLKRILEPKRKRLEREAV